MTGLVLCNDVTVERNEILVGSKHKYETKILNTTKEDIILLKTAKRFGVVIQEKVNNKACIKIKNPASNARVTNPRLSYEPSNTSMFIRMLAGLQNTTNEKHKSLRMFAIKAIFPYD